MHTWSEKNKWWTNSETDWLCDSRAALIGEHSMAENNFKILTNIEYKLHGYL